VTVTEHVARTPRHTCFYLAAGTPGATPVIFVHGWPELAISWRHQLPAMAALGFHAVAPDMRGYGRSSIYATHADYALEHSVRDMVELLDHLGAERAVWVGHDWGAAVVWAIASHFPERCHGVANLCVPYFARGFAPENVLPCADRTVYPEAEFPWAQWEYMAFYEANFAHVQAGFEANVANTVSAVFRRGNPAAARSPSRTALVRKNNGWFGPANTAPDIPRDAELLSEAEWHAYTAALTRTRFFGPGSWYMNHAASIAYAKQAKNDGRITLPALFLQGAYDYTCETMTSRLAEPMRADCADLTEVVVPSGHWMTHQKPRHINAALARWLGAKFPSLWIS
jgi:pimeloyl-ACP methyl ester carboxylesterase